MKNITVNTENNELIIRIKLNEPTERAASGRSNILATTRGFYRFDTVYGLNVILTKNA